MIMKEQKIFSVVVVEKIENTIEATGVIQGIDRKVLFNDMVSAVTPRAAEQKAMKAVKGSPDPDNLEVKVEAVNFPG
jgi:hypothetical protein